MLNQLLAMVEKIPATFWGVVIGSFFSLGGIVIVNRANAQRLREQFEHDRQMQNRDRELSLRKDIYLSAAEAVSTGINTIGRFADLEIPDNKLTEAYIDKSPAIAKVHLIAKERTAEAVTNLVGELSAAYLRLAAKRYPVIAQKSQISFLQQQIDSFSRERDRMLELMKQHNFEGSTDQHRWKFLEDTFGFEQSRINEATQQQAALLADFAAKQIQLMKECIAEVNRVSRLTAPVIASARAELEMPIDERGFAQLIEQSIKKQEVNLAAFVKSIQSPPTNQPATAAPEKPVAKSVPRPPGA
ncbi:MAG: hypothetical protein WAO02_18430 [Verrucomicrobiia bacterium]